MIFSQEMSHSISPNLMTSDTKNYHSTWWSLTPSVTMIGLKMFAHKQLSHARVDIQMKIQALFCY